MKAEGRFFLRERSEAAVFLLEKEKLRFTPKDKSTGPQVLLCQRQQNRPMMISVLSVAAPFQESKEIIISSSITKK